MRQQVHKVLSGRRLSLPKWFMEENNLKEGDWVIIKQYERSFEIIPARIVPKNE